MTMPDVEGALRTWLRAQTTGVSQRVYFGIPTGATEAKFPLITVALVGSRDDASDAPIDNTLVQVDVWGALDASGHGLKADTTAIVNTVRALFQAVKGRTALNASVDCFGIGVESCVWLPDADNDRPRYAMTVSVEALSS